jgi:signal transduction histidine kinase
MNMPMNTPKSLLSAPFQDDSMLEGVARQVMSDINQFFSKERLERATMEDERERLARELHDGVLQSLAAVRLQLDAVARLIDENPQAAQKRLLDIGNLIANEQRDLRTWIGKLRPATAASMASSAELAVALETLCQQAETLSGLRVGLTTSRGMIRRALGDEVYRLVQEALANVAQHARAQCVDVGLQITRDRVHITVTDDGVGFPFHGRYDLATLVEKYLGPRSLKERVASLHGELILTSTLHGSKLEMSLPVHAQQIAGSKSAVPPRAVMSIDRN